MRRKVPVFRVNLPPDIPYSHLTEVPEIKQVVIEEVVYTIKKIISLFEVGNSEYTVELEKDKWQTSLESAIEYYAEKEEYDKCIECRDLITKI